MGNSCRREGEQEDNCVRILICTDETGLNQYKVERLIKMLVKKYGSPNVIYTSPTPSAQKLTEEIAMMLPTDVKIEIEEELIGRYEPWIPFISRIENLIFRSKLGITWHVTHDTVLTEVVRKYRSWSIDRNDLDVTVEPLGVAVLEYNRLIEYFN